MSMGNNEGTFYILCRNTESKSEILFALSNLQVHTVLHPVAIKQLMILFYFIFLHHHFPPCC